MSTCASRRTSRRDPLRCSRGDYVGYEGPLWRFVDTFVPKLYAADVPTLDACNSWYSGAYLMETVPCAIYILMRHAHDAEEAIVRAVNDTRDNDTIAAIVGAAVGALHGLEALHERWRTGLLGRIGATDDGHVFEVIDEAVSRWCA